MLGSISIDERECRIHVSSSFCFKSLEKHAGIM